MKCPDCKRNGIRVIDKISLVFGLDVRCYACGVLFCLHRGSLFLVTLTLHLVVTFSIIYAFVYLKSAIAYLSCFLAVLFLGTFVTYLPIRVKSRVGSARKFRR